ncbi:MAG: protelomerase family protein [Cyanobacteria bacterium P01_A01_bin.17]
MDAIAARETIIERYRQRISLGKHVRLYKRELEELIHGFIDTLETIHEPEQIQAACQNEIELLEEGYPRPTLASSYIPRYRKAIAEAISTKKLPSSKHRYLHHQRLTGLPQERDEHWALTFFKYSQEQYEHLDHRQAKTNRKRLLNLQKVNPWQYLDTLNELLLATGKFAARHRTIAIVGFTGRRFGEVVARGSFSLTSHPYLLRFEGQQKSERDGYDIITLIPAEIILMHLERLREMPELKPLAAMQGQELKRAINKFDVQVNRECDKLLMKPGIMPPLDGKDHVTIHNLRSLWGAIATFLFCPPEQHEYAFLQHYLGHILESSATGHYFRYMLVDSRGQLLQQKGVKLQDIPPLPLLEIEDATEEIAAGFDTVDPSLDLSPEQQPQDREVTQTAPRQRKNKEMNAEELQASLRQDWLQEIEQVKQELRSDWSEQLTTFKQQIEQQMTTLQRQLQPEAVQELTQEIDTLKTELDQAQQEKQEIAAQLADAQAKLNSFRQLLLGNEEVKKEVKEQPTESRAKTSSTPPTQKRRRRASGKAAQRAQTIFDAIRAWNDQHPDDTLAFSPGLLETIFKVHRKAAKEFCQEFQNEIEDHHAEIGVERILTHNKGKDIDGFRRFAEAFQ